MQVLGLWQRLRVEGTKYHRTGAIAAEQRGLASRQQLLDAGLSYGQIRRLVVRHWLIVVHSNVFAVGYYAADEPLVRETAGLLTVRSPAWLSHRSAAAVWGLTCLDSDHGPVHVTVAGSSAPTRPGVCVHRSRRVEANDRRLHNGLPVLSPARMLLEISADVTERELERAYDDVLVRGLARPSDFRELLGRSTGHRGRTRLQSLVDVHTETTLTRSEAEERMLKLIRASGLPQPLVNHRVHGFEVDFYWPSQRLVLEVDGFRYHSTPAAFERDHRRDAVLRSHGLPPMRFSWRQIVNEPMLVIAQVAQGLGDRSPL